MFILLVRNKPLFLKSLRLPESKLVLYPFVDILSGEKSVKLKKSAELVVKEDYWCHVGANGGKKEKYKTKFTARVNSTSVYKST